MGDSLVRRAEPGWASFCHVGKMRLLTTTGATASWWFPLAVTGAAATTSYLATWLFKRRDVERELAMRSLALVDEAADLVQEEDSVFENAGGYAEVKRLTAAIQIAVRPLQDPDLDYRALVAGRFVMDTFGWSVPRV